MKVRTKFRVCVNTETEPGLHTVSLTPVIGGSEENEEFFKYTPSGEVYMYGLNADAAALFVPGAELYVDFSKAA